MTSTRHHGGIDHDVQRIDFRHIRPGMTLLWKHEVVGTVDATDYDEHRGTVAVTLNNGQRMTANGWANRSLWRIVD